MVAEHHKRANACLGKSGQTVPEGKLGPQASVRKVKNVTGNQQKIHGFFDTQVYQFGKGLKSCRSKRFRRCRELGSNPLEGAAEMEISRMNERKGLQSIESLSGDFSCRPS
jgi:hypothetical protein